jgi:hypothetical protein
LPIFWNQSTRLLSAYSIFKSDMSQGRKWLFLIGKNENVIFIWQALAATRPIISARDARINKRTKREKRSGARSASPTHPRPKFCSLLQSPGKQLNAPDLFTVRRNTATTGCGPRTLASAGAESVVEAQWVFVTSAGADAESRSMGAVRVKQVIGGTTVRVVTVGANAERRLRVSCCDAGRRDAAPVLARASRVGALFIIPRFCATATAFLLSFSYSPLPHPTNFNPLPTSRGHPLLPQAAAPSSCPDTLLPLPLSPHHTQLSTPLYFPFAFLFRISLRCPLILVH